jgi:hypothetical protein
MIRKTMTLLFCLALVAGLLSSVSIAHAQNPVPHTENFDSIGTSATCTAPLNLDT